MMSPPMQCYLKESMKLKRQKMSEITQKLTPSRNSRLINALSFTYKLDLNAIQQKIEKKKAQNNYTSIHSVQNKANIGNILSSRKLSSNKRACYYETASQDELIDDEDIRIRQQQDIVKNEIELQRRTLLGFYKKCFKNYQPSRNLLTRSSLSDKYNDYTSNPIINEAYKTQSASQLPKIKTGTPHQQTSKLPLNQDHHSILSKKMSIQSNYPNSQSSKMISPDISYGIHQKLERRYLSNSRKSSIFNDKIQENKINMQHFNSNATYFGFQ
ncbi:UNKNOWN [Stylonychia lemnae]|uniref:Uncharacterized protein n=1 Tax=Stylonychia lemnae TaxID=5949 RepID=A0A078BEX9_STYLE|nr:UNKNOWN [Stylonychia lemnae]|eukprot:CDW91717.1 UNKNOWN [Stylonychia lemnae]